MYVKYMTLNLWRCQTGSKYPFYVIKNNMGIIPIHNASDLRRLEKENIQSDKNILFCEKSFCIYYPHGPHVQKATQE